MRNAEQPSATADTKKGPYKTCSNITIPCSQLTSIEGYVSIDTLANVNFSIRGRNRKGDCKFFYFVL